MPERRLQLRALPMIVVAYLVAPLVTVSALWLVWYGPWASPGMAGLGGGEAWTMLWPAGVLVCLIAELLFATPLLVGFSRYRWWWLNGWTACGILKDWTDAARAASVSLDRSTVKLPPTRPASGPGDPRPVTKVAGGTQSPGHLRSRVTPPPARGGHAVGDAAAGTRPADSAETRGELVGELFDGARQVVAGGCDPTRGWALQSSPGARQVAAGGELVVPMRREVLARSSQGGVFSAAL